MYPVRLCKLCCTYPCLENLPRCPMECSMSRTTDAWSCSISLRFDYDLDGSHSHQSAVPFGPTLRAKSDVEIWLRRAQAAILSPHVRSETFHKLSYQELRNTAADRRTLKFSKNVVVVDIQDPDATDLSFVDLPGEFKAYLSSGDCL